MYEWEMIIIISSLLTAQCRTHLVVPGRTFVQTGCEDLMEMNGSEDDSTEQRKVRGVMLMKPITVTTQSVWFWWFLWHYIVRCHYTLFPLVMDGLLNGCTTPVLRLKNVIRRDTTATTQIQKMTTIRCRKEPPNNYRKEQNTTTKRHESTSKRLKATQTVLMHFW